VGKQSSAQIEKVNLGVNTVAIALKSDLPTIGQDCADRSRQNERAANHKHDN